MSATDWHNLEPADALERLGSRLGGLSGSEASARLEAHGPNRLPAARRRPAWRRFLAQFHNVLIYVLVAAAVTAGLLDHMLDAAVIAAVVLVNAVIGFMQEGKAERAMDAIGRMLPVKARVMRDGAWQTLDAEALVPGDVVELHAGDRVPGDMRLIECHGLRIDEAALTGESLPVTKRPVAQAPETPLAERAGMAFSGTMVSGGQAVGVVCATALETEIGRISRMLSEVEVLTTPLLRQINQFARVLTVIILVLTAFTIGAGALIHGLSLTEGFLAGVALAVAAIPEGLPAIITITLAVGVRRMASRRAIIRRLPAVETLGAVSVICSDKTGTLTRNVLEVRRVVFPVGGPSGADQSGQDAPPTLLEAAVLCNDADPAGGDGDPLETALVRLALDAGIDIADLRTSNPRLGLIPFSSDLKFMASLHPGRICLKGAPEKILERCSGELITGGIRALDHGDWQEKLHALAADGMRIIAVAEKRVREDRKSLSGDDVEGELCLLGLVGFEDPPRAEVPDAVRACFDAGIAVKMITGDHPATAGAIAARLGISGPVFMGAELDAMDDADLADRVAGVNVYARTTPAHKLRLVTALQAQNRVVAMTGDGANDAPALKRADIGVAMGIKGTEASRQAAEMVLADDNFATIVNGVEEGRGVYDNIRKSLLFILPTNGAEALVVLLAVLAGMTLPITPVQILWINMATAVTLALSLAFEPLEGNVMRRPPRPAGQGLLTPFVVTRIAWVAVLLTAGAFAAFTWALDAGGDIDYARTMAMNVLVVGEIFYLFNTRRWVEPGYTMEALFANPWAWLSVGALIVMQAGIVYLPPAQQIFGTTALDAVDWLLITGFGIVVFVAVELEKALLRRK